MVLWCLRATYLIRTVQSALLGSLLIMIKHGDGSHHHRPFDHYHNPHLVEWVLKTKYDTWRKRQNKMLEEKAKNAKGRNSISIHWVKRVTPFQRTDKLTLHSLSTPIGKPRLNPWHLCCSLLGIYLSSFTFLRIPHIHSHSRTSLSKHTLKET